jgi:hypothetical protein
MAHIKLTSTAGSEVAPIRMLSVEIDGEVRRDILGITIDASATEYVAATVRYVVTGLEVDVGAVTEG